MRCSRESRDLLSWFSDTMAPDEYVWPTLNHNPQLHAPGAYKGEITQHAAPTPASSASSLDTGLSSPPALREAQARRAYVLLMSYLLCFIRLDIYRTDLHDICI